jgi:zinc protease
MTARRAFFTAAFAALLLPLALSAQSPRLTREQALFDAGTINQFARENAPTFSVATLSNGIPVIIKQSTSNRILSLKVVLQGHVSFTPVAKAGLESMMLRMLTRGSAHYSYAEVQRKLFETSSSISANSGSFDSSSLDLVTIDTYFNDMFPVFADAFLHPQWNAEEFPRVSGDFKRAKQQEENDPYSLMNLLLRESFFAGHPYEAYFQGAGYSLEGITLDDAKGYYDSTVKSGRLFIVAVGNFDRAKLVSMLDSTFGLMPRAPYTRPPVPSFQGTVKSDLIVETYPQSTGLAYVRGNFAMPGQDSADYAPSLVAFNLLDDLLFEIVRTRNGAAYSIGASMHGFTATYGDITVFKTATPGKVKPLIDQAISVLASGQSMGGNVTASAAGKSGIGSAGEAKAGSFVPIADALPFYKASFLSQFYSGQQTNTMIASQIASSILYNGDFRDYLLFIDRINAVTADDVVRVTKKYLIDNPTLWIVLGDPVLLKDVRKDDFMRFTPAP